MKVEAQISAGIAMVCTLIALNLSAWCTHVWSCFTNEQWGFLIAGAIAVPVAIVHGIGIWFGAW